MTALANSQDTPQSTTTYRDILRSTAVIGGSTLVVLAVSLVRMKVLAVLLGPAGVGLMALYNSVIDLVVAFAGLGVQQSGVRQIAQSAAGESDEQLNATAAIVRRISLLLGIAGAAGMALLCVPISLLTFGTAAYALPVALVGLVVLFKLHAGGQTALLQGTRRIGDLARLNIFGALTSVAVTIPLVLLWGEAGIVPALIVMAGVASLIAWHYGRRVAVVPQLLSRGAVKRETMDLVRLGLAFMISGFVMMGAAYLIRIIILHEDGVAAAGIYQAAWGLAGLYVGCVLQAMGMDFYPRLTGVADDDAMVNRLVNEQTQVSLLLAGPGVIATITLAPLAIAIFYSQEFLDAVGLLRLLGLGMMLRVVAWPMGYIIVAKGWQRTFIIVEVLAALIHVGLTAILVPMIGVDGAGIAFAGLYLYHALLVYWIVRKKCGFRLSPANAQLFAIFAPATAIAFAGFIWLPFWWATAVGLAVTCACGVFSLYALVRLTPPDVLPRPLLAVLARLGFSP